MFVMWSSLNAFTPPRRIAIGLGFGGSGGASSGAGRCVACSWCSISKSTDWPAEALRLPCCDPVPRVAVGLEAQPVLATAAAARLRAEQALEGVAGRVDRELGRLAAEIVRRHDPRAALERQHAR